MLENFLSGLESALTLQNFLLLLVGVVGGTVIGMLPGLGAASGMALLMPLAAGLDPLPGLILLAAVYYGTQYGGSITSILLNTPGDAGQLMTTLDGYAMAKRGKAGTALTISAVSSFAGGILTIPLMVILGPALAEAALRLGPPEMLVLLVFALVSVAAMTSTHRTKAYAMAAFGILLSTVGFDPQSGVPRLTFGQPDLLNGINLVPVIIGVFALGEVLNQLGAGTVRPMRARFRELFPRWSELRESLPPTLRGSVIGFVVGVLPAAGSTIAAYFAYDVERRIPDKGRRPMGTGSVRGVAAPEAANNAAVNGAFVPTLSLGIPGSATTAILLGALLVYGVQPGPSFIPDNPELYWGLVASFLLGNIALLVLNVPLVPFFASALRVPYLFLFPAVVATCLIGAYALRNNLFDVLVAAVFGLVGFLMIRGSYPPAPLVLGLVFGRLLEENLVRTSGMGRGDLGIILERPISLTLVVLTVLVVVAPPVVAAVRRGVSRRQPAAAGTTEPKQKADTR
ncbi:tripartite tricarboxylate transporter permease [Promicromonospora xylanilytica]